MYDSIIWFYVSTFMLVDLPVDPDQVAIRLPGSPFFNKPVGLFKANRPGVPVQSLNV